MKMIAVMVIIIIVLILIISYANFYFICHYIYICISVLCNLAEYKVTPNIIYADYYCTRFE